MWFARLARKRLVRDLAADRRGVSVVEFAFVAPIFLAAEVFFALGYKPRLHREVQRRAEEMRNRALTPISVEPRAERG